MNVQRVQATNGAFATVLADGSVVTWGKPTAGGDSCAVQHMLKNVQEVQATNVAFASRRISGDMRQSNCSGSSVQDQPRNVRRIQAANAAFAAISAEGTAVSWGHPLVGGDSSAVQDQLRNVQADSGQQWGICCSFGRRVTDYMGYAKKWWWLLKSKISSKMFRIFRPPVWHFCNLGRWIGGIMGQPNWWLLCARQAPHCEANGSVLTWGSPAGDDSSVQDQLQNHPGICWNPGRRIGCDVGWLRRWWWCLPDARWAPKSTADSGDLVRICCGLGKRINRNMVPFHSWWWELCSLRQGHEFLAVRYSLPCISHLFCASIVLKGNVWAVSGCHHVWVHPFGNAAKWIELETSRNTIACKKKPLYKQLRYHNLPYSSWHHHHHHHHHHHQNSRFCMQKSSEIAPVPGKRCQQRREAAQLRVTGSCSPRGKCGSERRWALDLIALMCCVYVTPCILGRYFMMFYHLVANFYKYMLL